MKAVLLLRAAIGLLFGVRLLAATDAGWTRVFGWLADYLVIDGAIALIIAAALIWDSVAGSRKREMIVGVIVLVDGLGRTGAGLSVHIWPGIPDVPPTALAFLGIMAACTALLGFVATAIVGDEERARHGRYHERPQFRVGPVAVAAIAAVAFGVSALAFIANPAMIRPLLALYMIAGAFVMLVAARPRPFRSRDLPTAG
jgi:hypothetical protein